MKKFLTFFLTALLTFSVGWAANVTDVLNRAFTGVTMNTTTYSDWSGKTGESGAVYAGNSAGGNNSIQLRTSNSNSGVVTTTSGGKVRRVWLEWNSSTAAGRNLQVYGKNSAYTDATDLYNSNTQGTLLGTLSVGNANAILTVSGDYEYIGVRSSSGALYLTSINIVWEQGDAPSVTPPTITPDGGDILASQQISLSAEDGASIYYTINGDNPTTSSTLYTAPFTLNSGATVKAIAVKDGVSSTVTSATFNVVAGVPTIAEALNTTEQFIFAGHAVVVYQNGSYLYIKDESGWGLVYGTVNGTYNNGNFLNPGWKATKTVYRGLPEFGSPVADTFSSSDSGDEVTPETLTTIDEDTELNMYAFMSNLKVSEVNNGNISLQGVNFQLRNTIGVSDLPTFEVGKTYNVRGFTGVYNGTYQFYPIWAEEVVTGDPTITLDPTSLTIDDSGTNNSFTVTARNLHENDNGNVSVAHNWVFNTNLTSGTNSIANWNGLQGFNRNYRSVDGTVTVNYEGRALTATDTYTVATEGASQTLTVTYVPSLYIVGNFGNAGWNYSADAATPMTNDGNGIYTATLEIPANSYILFSRKSGETYNWDNNRYFIGAVMDNGQDWVYGVNALPGLLDTDPSNPSKYRPIKFPEGGTYTITIDANNYTFNITKEVPLPGDFVLVTDDSQLAEGNEIIIVNSGTAGEAKAMSTTQGNNNRPATNVTVRSILAVTATDETQIITLERAEGDNPGWYFNVGNGYLYAASNSSNHLKTHDTTTDSEVAISIGDDNIASIVFQGQYSRNVMQYNQGSDLFSCYGSASQSPVYIYQRTAQNASLSADKQHITLVTPAGADESEPQTFTVTGSNLTENVTLTVDNPNFVLNPTTIVPENGAVSQLVTVTYVGESTITENETITITSSGKTVEVYVHGRKEATTLAQIEASTDLLNKKVAVSDELIGAWAYGNKLWAKDQGNASIDKRMAATDQMDYLQQEIWHDQDGNVYHLQTGSWDESNWVVLDFNGLRGETTAAACVGKKLTDVKGTYSDSKNFTITLTDPVTATADADAAALYPGYQQSVATHVDPYDLGYNSYIPANFYESNWNGVDAINSNTYVDNLNDDAVISLYFMNPKVQEVARIWGVWNGNGGFAVYNEGYFNRFGIHGAVNVGGWNYNSNGGVAADLVKDKAYLFHAVVAKPATKLGAVPPTASNDAASSTLVIYPLDLSAQGSMTAVKDIVGDRTVKSVSYYNIMGVESAQPHDGVNIVVTRYTDGSTSTAKVMF